jgi:type IV secretory pathway protease TraF/predicted DNA-binding transcriptional regulator AlpA
VSADCCNPADYSYFYAAHSSAKFDCCFAPSPCPFYERFPTLPSPAVLDLWPSRFLRTPEAARFLGVSTRTLEKHRSYGTGPKYRKIGGRVIYALVDLKAWADLSIKSSTSDPGDGTVSPAKPILAAGCSRPHSSPRKRREPGSDSESAPAPGLGSSQVLGLQATQTVASTARAAAILVATTGWGLMPWLVWNTSESAPIGLYRVQTAGKLMVNDLGIVIPPKPLVTFIVQGSYLARGVALLKRVRALGCQTVCRIGYEITIDGIEVGQALERDLRGRSLPDWQSCQHPCRRRHSALAAFMAPESCKRSS